MAVKHVCRRASRAALLASVAALAFGHDAAAQTGGAARPAPSAAPSAPPRMPEVPQAARTPTAGPAAAPGAISAFILRGRAVRGTNGADRTVPMPMAPGMRVESPPGTWTEIAFSDGSSVVLQAGADFTLQGIASEGGRLVISGAASRGSLRASTSDGVDLLIRTAAAEVRVTRASAVIEAGPNGAATMLSGRRVTIRRNGGEEEVIRRPGFAVALDGGGPERRTRGQMATSLAPFAPVQVPEGVAPRAGAEAPGEAAEAETVPPPAEQQLRRQRSETLLAVNTGRASGGGQGGFSTGTGAYLTAAGTGSAIAGGGTSLLGSTTTGFNAQPVAGSVDTQLLGGIEARQSLGTGRVRRFSAEASGAQAGRLDAGRVATAGGASVVGGAFAGPGEGRSAASDLVANLGFVTLSVFAPAPGNNAGTNVLAVPRLSVSATGSPSASYVTSGGTPLATVTLPGFRGGPGGPTAPTPRDILPNTAYYVDFGGTTTPPAFFTTYGLDGLSAAEIAARFDAALRTTSYYDTFDPGTNTVSAGFVGQSQRILAYQRSTILEAGLHALPADVSPGAITAPATFARTVDGRGTVATLPDGGGTLVYLASTPPPEARVVNFSNVNPSAVAYNRAGNTPPNPAPTRFTLIYDTVVTARSPAFAAQVAQGTLTEGERYFVIGGTPVPATATGMPGIAGPGQVTRYAISDGLYPNGGLVTGQTVEAQFRGPGDPNQPVLFNRFNAFRPEGTFIGAAPRADTHLLVASGSAATPNVAMRADLEVAPGGGSSASVSVGGVALDRSGVSLVLSGSTVGTARLGGGPVAIGGRFGSMGTDATGIQAHLFYGAESGEQVGHLAIGQQDVRRGAPGGDGGQPGTVEVLGGAASPYGFTRLATNVTARTGQSRPADVAPQGGAVSFLGFATGFVETPQGGQINLHSVSAPSYGIAIERADGSNEFAAVIDLTPRAPGQMALNPFATLPSNGASGTQRLEFGARDPNTGQPTSAWIGAGTFAAVRPGTVAADGVTTRADGAALVSADANLQQAFAAVPGFAMPASNGDMAWGLFLGDLVNDSGGTRRDHANLGFWVAGRPVDFATLSNLRGTFTYSGGMLGTAAQNGAVRVAAGGFTQSWDFGSRTGRLAASYDGRDYNARIAMLGSNAIFTGSGLDGQRDRRLVVQGGFFGTAGNGTPPPSVGGAFGIAGSGYAANGIFAGRRVP
ncbi:hypothetical protein [Plastoroseomonas arctica]|uniref:FecR protein domain-containing protein n=1 Tax=Plastoroseomonas arctica TaxID=1509237 RepID=A0AAF1JVD7_9PROT|nr:hypothetical protein [Plastoroseomonas arctica]MBR0654532.1 hypothetical protein [Plastoroseomonas arctica]